MAEEVKTINICERDCRCCIDRIYSSIKKEPQWWKEMEATRFTDTPLHRAAEAGNTEVAVEILNLMPSMGKKLNPEGLSPLHLAIEKERTETTLAMARFDKQLVRVKGKGGMTPLMQCAAKAGDKKHRELLASLLVACPDSVFDVNNKNETVVHVALLNSHCDAAVVLVNWLRRRDQIAAVLTVEDVQGNTALHVAARFGCVQGAQRLVHLVKLNRRNHEKKTALDVAEEYQTEVARVLRGKGARRGTEIPSPKTTVDYLLSNLTYAESISRAYHNLTQELTLEMRSAVLVVAALIISATYQVVLQPPGGIYPPAEAAGSAEAYRHQLQRHQHVQARRLVTSDELWRKHLAGQMVMEKTHYRYFMPANTFAFALSAVIMIFVVPGSPIFLILHICLVFMCLSYLLALDTISFYSGISDRLYFMAAYAIFGAFIVKLLYYPIKALLVEEDWWLRRFTVKHSNFWGQINLRRGGCAAKAALDIADSMKKQHRVLDLK